MRQLPPALAPNGYSPARHSPLSPAPVSDQGQRLTDIAAIQRLFANGENGGYWPADSAYLYEDSAGTLPASFNGVVGARFDVSKGLVLGAELITNGTFDSDTWWVKSGTTIANGVATFVSAGSSIYIYKTNILTAGRIYRVLVSIPRSASGGLIISDYATAPYAETGMAGTGDFVRQILATTAYVMLQRNSAVNGGVCDFDVDNVSFKEILGNHAIQSTTANKPYLRRTPVSNKYWLDSNTSTVALTATFASSLGSACTIARVGAEGVTIAENQTVGTTYNLCPYNASQLVRYRGDTLIINRALTLVEKALVTRHFKRGVPMISNGAIL